jgi:hypothetical protein
MPNLLTKREHIVLSLMERMLPAITLSPTVNVDRPTLTPGDRARLLAALDACKFLADRIIAED